MSYLDIIFIVVLSGGTLLGTISGFFWQMARIIILLLSAIVSIYVQQPIANYLLPQTSEQNALKIILYLFIFTAIYLILFLITYLIEQGLKKDKPMNLINRILGGLLGFLKTALICGIILIGTIIYPLSALEQTIKNSFISPYLVIYTTKTVFLMPNKTKQQLSIFIDRLLKSNRLDK
ncbi:MAG: CvpA family protein [Planctomycetota bacterium]